MRGHEFSTRLEMSDVRAHREGLNSRDNDAQKVSSIRAVKNASYQRVAFFFSPLYSRNRDASRLSSAHAGVVTSYRLGEVSSFPHMAPEAL